MKEIFQFAEMPSYYVTVSEDESVVYPWKGIQSSEASAPKEAPPVVSATETDFVEIGLAFHAAHIFPTLTQENIMDMMRKLSGLPLANWEQLGANIRRRESLTFLARLQNGLVDRNEEIKENGRANRRPKLPQK